MSDILKAWMALGGSYGFIFGIAWWLGHFDFEVETMHDELGKS